MRGDPWKPGQSGNPKGCPPGSRNKLGEAFVEALLKDFDEHGAGAIVACRETKPEVYLMVVSKVIPSDLNLKTDGLEAFIKVWEAISIGAMERSRTTSREVFRRTSKWRSSKPQTQVETHLWPLTIVHWS